LLAYVCTICYYSGTITRKYTTQHVADALGVPKRTLISWILRGKIPEVCFEPQGGVKKFRWWSDEDVLRAAPLAVRLKDKRKKRSTT